MADKTEWVWHGHQKHILGLTQERAEAQKNQFVKKVEELLQKDYPGIKFIKAKEYYRKPIVCDITDCFDKDSFDFLFNHNCLGLTDKFIQILPPFFGENSNECLKIDSSDFNPEDLSHYQDDTGNCLQLFPDVTLYQYKVCKNFNIQFNKDKDDYAINHTMDERAKYINIRDDGLERVKKAIVKVKSPEISIVNTVKKNFTIFNALIDTYKEPYTQWKNDCNKQLKVEEVLRKKLLILAEK